MTQTVAIMWPLIYDVKFCGSTVKINTIMYRRKVKMTGYRSAGPFERKPVNISDWLLPSSCSLSGLSFSFNCTLTR